MYVGIILLFISVISSYITLVSQLTQIGVSHMTTNFVKWFCDPNALRAMRICRYKAYQMSL